jgi:hypothetical protein
MFMDLPTTHELITLIQPTRSSVSGFIAGHICVPAGGGEDTEVSVRGDSGDDDCPQEEAKRLLAKFGKRIGAATPSSGVAEVSAAHRALLGHTV